MDLRIGCCGFAASKKEYYRKFGAVEVQKTFYDPPRPGTAKKWRSEAPEGFEFTVRAWQLITHESGSPSYRRLKRKLSASRKKKCGSFRPTDEVFSAWEETEKIASALGSKVILFQTPASFTPTKTNKENMRGFFRALKRKKYRLAWEPGGGWPDRDVKELCAGLDLAHCVDPFQTEARSAGMRYFRLQGMGGDNYRYKGLDLKKLRDLCENEYALSGEKPLYVFFNNKAMLYDAQRFEWIARYTGRIEEQDISFLENLCHEIEAEEEDEKVQLLSREAERIVSLILHTDYAKVDIEIEKGKLHELCRKMFPDKTYLYDMIYGQRFDRLWEQFRERTE